MTMESVEFVMDRIGQLEAELSEERRIRHDTVTLVHTLQEELTSALDSVVEAEAERKARVHTEGLLAACQRRCEALAQKLIETVRCRDSQVEEELRVAREVLAAERATIVGTLQSLMPRGVLLPVGRELEAVYSAVSAIRDQIRGLQEMSHELRALSPVVGEKLDKLLTCSSCDGAPLGITAGPIVALPPYNTVAFEEEAGRQRIVMDMMSDALRIQTLARGSVHLKVSLPQSKYPGPFFVAPPQRTLISPALSHTEKENTDPVCVLPSQHGPPPRGPLAPPPPQEISRSAPGGASSSEPSPDAIVPVTILPRVFHDAMTEPMGYPYRHGRGGVGVSRQRASGGSQTKITQRAGKGLYPSSSPSPRERS